MRWLALISLLGLCACTFEGRFGLPPAQIVAPPGDRVIEEPNGTVVAEPAAPPIETTITALSQAQQLRMLVRQLAR